MTKVKDIQCGQLRVMLIQHEKKARNKDGWLFLPSLIGSGAVAVSLAFSGAIWSPVGMAIGISCLAWWAILAVANVKATRWGGKVTFTRLILSNLALIVKRKEKNVKF